MMAKKKIYSKRSKTVKGEYDVFRNKKKIGEIFKGPSDQGGRKGWVGVITDPQLEAKQNLTYGGSSVGAPTKWRVLDWFWEWMGN